MNTVNEFKQKIKNVIIDNKFNKIGISLSGGMDSSILLYILCDVISNDFNNQIKIIPITGVGDSLKEVVLPIISYVRNKYNLVPFEPHEFIEYNTNFETKWFKYHIPFHTKLYNDKKIDVLLHAGTRNIPEDELKNIEFNEKSIDTNRSLSPTQIVKELGFRTYEDSGHPQWNIFMNQDKKFTAELYTELNLHNNLAPLTWSCVSTPLDSVFKDKEKHIFSEPCKKCYWCAEKFWAYGYY